VPTEISQGYHDGASRLTNMNNEPGHYYVGASWDGRRNAQVRCAYVWHGLSESLALRHTQPKTTELRVFDRTVDNSNRTRNGD
jgi:hypothetical protein